MEHLSLAVGGVVSASAPEELPQNEKQVTNLRQQAKLKGHPYGPSGEVDDLFYTNQRRILMRLRLSKLEGDRNLFTYSGSC